MISALLQKSKSFVRQYKSYSPTSRVIYQTLFAEKSSMPPIKRGMFLKIVTNYKGGKPVQAHPLY